MKRSFAIVLILSLAAVSVSFYMKEEMKPAMIVNSVGMRLIRIPAGSFLMGAYPDEEVTRGNERKQQKVQISRDFYIQQTELTHAHFKPVMGEFAEVPVFGRSGNNYPVVGVAFNPNLYKGLSSSHKDDKFHINDYIEKLNQREGCKLSLQEIWEVYQGKSGKDAGGCYRLPTEAEWEYACRGGTEGPTFYDDPEDIGQYAIGPESSSNGYVETRSRKPNPYGLYDVLGNVSEFVMDSPAKYSRFPTTSAIDPYQAPDPENSKPDVLTRGGDYRSARIEIRCNARNWIYSRYDNPKYSESHFGYRLVRNP